jgi:Methyltransferase domain
MSEYSTEWLALREPYDLAARNAVVLESVASAFVGQAAISVVDLACGTGAMLRALGPHLPSRQSWNLVDNDLSLLARASPSGSPPHLTVTTTTVDLAHDLERVLDGPVDLVTTSALLDLVSPEWLDRLVVEVAARRLPFYGALTYDGRAVAEPLVHHDVELLAGFNLHQRTDKGFGPALGPSAAACAARRFEQFGYLVVEGHSDWLFGPGDRDIQEALFARWAEVGPLTTTLSSHEIAGWLAWRRSHLAQGRSRLRVGHVDIFAHPIGTR